MKRAQLLLFVFFLLYPACQALAKPWRGIIPLHSTITDVENLLKVKSSGTGYDEFKHDKDIIQVRYVTKSCQQGKKQKWNVPIGTVISIWTRPQGGLTLYDFGLDLDRFEISGTDVVGVKIYTDNEDGFRIEANERTGEISVLYYFENAMDRKSLQCQ